MAHKPVVLIIRDGWGYSEEDHGNAIKHARKPYYDEYLKKYPRAILEASGEAVGLLPGFFGNSEVNHLNMGAGRVVRQDLRRIHEAIEDKTFMLNVRLRGALAYCRKHKKALHLFGILQEAAVHGHLSHAIAMLEVAHEMGVPEIYIHAFTDGRDSPPRSAHEFFIKLMPYLGTARIGSVIGRYYLDRGGNYELTKVAYETMVKAKGKKCLTVEQAIGDAYDCERCPDASPMTDEYLTPSTIGDFPGIKEGDCVICWNFRQDRAIQISKAFLERMWGGPKVEYFGMTKYFDEFDQYIMPPLSPETDLKNMLGDVLSQYKKRQYRIADSQKFRHVTSFFNGKRIVPFPGEDRTEVGLPHPDQYSVDPGMGAREITEIVTKVIEHGVYDFVMINFSNCDNVGHTAYEEAIMKAVEIVDACTGKVVDATLARGGVALVTADHGNAEEIYEMGSRKPRTAHTTNPTELFYIGHDYESVQLRPQGIIPDIAPTILDILGIEKPPEMTAESLIVR